VTSIQLVLSPDRGDTVGAQCAMSPLSGLRADIDSIPGLYSPGRGCTDRAHAEGGSGPKKVVPGASYGICFGTAPESAKPRLILFQDLEVIPWTILWQPGAPRSGGSNSRHCCRRSAAGPAFSHSFPTTPQLQAEPSKRLRTSNAFPSAIRLDVSDVV
jgi:hypothetical protein